MNTCIQTLIRASLSDDSGGSTFDLAIAPLHFIPEVGRSLARLPTWRSRPLYTFDVEMHPAGVPGIDKPLHAVAILQLGDWDYQSRTVEEWIEFNNKTERNAYIDAVVAWSNGIRLV